MVKIALAAVTGMLIIVTATDHQQQNELGKKIFGGKGNCATCHGADGSGTGLAPNLRDSVWINVDGSVEQIIQVVKAGVPKPKQHPAPMPPMGGAKLNEREIGAVAGYVAELTRR